MSDPYRGRSRHSQSSAYHSIQPTASGSSLLRCTLVYTHSATIQGTIPPMHQLSIPIPPPVNTGLQRCRHLLTACIPPPAPQRPLPLTATLTCVHPQVACLGTPRIPPRPLLPLHLSALRNVKRQVQRPVQAAPTVNRNGPIHRHSKVTPDIQRPIPTVSVVLATSATVQSQAGITLPDTPSHTTLTASSLCSPL